jgi:DNA-binding NarL/FixJ family response regulator
VEDESAPDSLNLWSGLDCGLRSGSRRAARRGPHEQGPFPTALSSRSATRRILGADDEARILVITTFDLDEYVYEALRAGASGFVLKDEPPELLIAAIRTIAAGDALLSPAVTKRVIERFSSLPQHTPPKELDELTDREREIFKLIAGGLSNAEIGQQRYISETTVKTHVTHVFQKLNVRDRVQAVVLAYQTGLVEPDD